MVERQARHDRVFVDRRVAAGRRLARASGLRGDERAGFRRRRRQGRPVLGAGQLVSRRRDADAVHHLDLRRAEPGAADVSERHAARGSDRGVDACSIWRRACLPSTGTRRSGICRRRTSSRTSTARAAFSPIGCRSRPAARCSSASRRPTRGARAACGTTTWRSTCPACGSCRGTTSRSVRTSRCSTTCAAPPRRRCADQQWAIIAPVAHCAYTRAGENTIVGERDMGDARLDYNDITYGFFDKFLKGDQQRTHREAGPRDVFHDGQQQVADLGRVAARRRPADDVPPVERRPRQLAERRRSARGGGARRRHAGRVHVRPDESGDVVRRQRVLHRQRDSRPARSISARWNRGTTSWSTRRSRSRKASRSAARSRRRSTCRRMRRTPTSR